jgi:hypothetical protein
MAEQHAQQLLTEAGQSSVLAWWGVKGNRVMEDRLQRFQQLASGLHRACSEAYQDELDALNMTNDCVSQSVQGLLRSQRLDEFFAVQTETLSGLMKAAFIHMKTWSELTQKIQGCYVDAARETTSDIGQEAREAASEVQEKVEQTMRTTRQRIRRETEG